MDFLQSLYENDKRMARIYDCSQQAEELRRAGFYVAVAHSAVYGDQTDAYLGTSTEVIGAVRSKDDICFRWTNEEDFHSDYYVTILDPIIEEVPEEDRDYEDTDHPGVWGPSYADEQAYFHDYDMPF